jgi:cysteine-S-conjugate beta-lyase
MPGLVMGLNFVSHLFASPDEAILTQTPIYPPFLNSPKNQNRTIHTAPLAMTRDGNRLRYELDMDALEAAVTPQTKVFLLCNPHNPGGRVWTRAELEQIAEFCLRHDLIIASDEIHCDLVYPEYQHISIASLSPEVAARTITLLAPSKTFNVPGLCASFAVVQDADMLKTLRDWVFANGAGVNVMGYTAMQAAYSGGQEWLDNVLPYLQVNRDVVMDYVDENMPDIPTTSPEGTYLMWMDCRVLNLPEGKTAQQFFLEKGRVALNDGSGFGDGGTGFVRLNFATTRDTVMEGLRRMKTAYDALKA